ncbi:MAG: 1-deoxy-D-xylulose-5-phosphate reductoisomerase [Gammaproteobacteria bacterium]|nr:1-deoxy-D-xylulose-5-phosphate reductoisomerase [Gammaproteobacteria bacterium]NNC97835.1 1-deoxy-D-xylulose-5-phosphate reductoisomerase [Gammaproteobacteria bacterium]NNM13708.1 1-deoxy-D-xylulose-5-phosphate reductoisomerase [Gammaproteobacteria bacterium]
MYKSEKKSVCILGATGSIGESSLSVISKHPDAFSVYALSANENADKMFALCKQYKPEFAVMADADAAAVLQDLLTHAMSGTQVLAGSGALDQIAAHDDVDIIIAAIVGAAGLSSTMAAATAGKKILLANKESLVIAGQYLLEAVRNNNAELIPLDSEHNAIFQCHPVAHQARRLGQADASVRKILLTASGGPFLHRPLDTFDTITVDQACAHPRWSMGRKISVDSATMMNKGLELIEACLLFGVAPEQVQVVIHPQSIVHSMVEYIDGSILAQLGSTDMRIPISYGLGFPQRISSGTQAMDIFKIAQLDFMPPCSDRFPALELARLAASDAKVLPTVMNAANEVCVDAFLHKRINFLQVAQIVKTVMQEMRSASVASLHDILDLDADARVATSKHLPANI